MTRHAKVDYFGSMLPEGATGSVLIHQLFKWGLQVSFDRTKGQLQFVLFHPIRPNLFMATQLAVYTRKIGWISFSEFDNVKTKF